MESLFSGIVDSLQQNNSLVLVSILQTKGSSPRTTGAMLAVFSDGTLGTIGGGKIEYLATVFAQELLAEGQAVSCRKAYNLTAEEAAGIGMACGGQMTVYFQYIAPEQSTIDFFKTLLTQMQTGESLWLVLCTDQEDWGMVLDNTQGHLCQCGSQGLDNLQVSQKENPEWIPSTPTSGTLIVPIVGRGKVYIFGAGHVSFELAKCLYNVDFACTVIDDREEFANRERFPNQEVIVNDYTTVFEQLTINPNDYIVIMTRGHISDYDVLIRALRTPAKYIGMIGSRAKIDTTYNRLLQEAHVDYAQLRRVTAPIGLSIGAQTPAEIGLCIAAQLIAIRNQKN